MNTTKNPLELEAVEFASFRELLTQASRVLQSPMIVLSLGGEVLLDVSVDCDQEEGRALVNHGTGYLNTVQEEMRVQQIVVHEGPGGASILGVPICSKSGVIAVLWALSRSNAETDRQSATAFLRAQTRIMGEQLYMQFELNTMTEELSRRYEELNLVYDLGKKLAESESTQQAVRCFVEQSIATLDHDMAVVSMPDKEIMEIASNLPHLGVLALPDKAWVQQMDEILLRRLALDHTFTPHVIVNDTGDDEELAPLFSRSVGLLAVPVKLMSGGLGYLCLVKTNHLFRTGDVRLAVSLTEQMSFVVTNAQLYHDLKSFMLNVIKVLIASIEAKDAYTRGHSERVQSLSMMIAEGLGLEAGEREVLSWAALLHDIGKIGVPEEILGKPGKLTEGEYTQVKYHSEQGYQILKPIEQLSESLPAIRHHHERFDGTGYPSGLQGRAIPLYARIIGVADTFDAMTTDRSYRRRLSDDKALTEILNVSGRQLDPDVVEAFADMYLSKKEDEMRQLLGIRASVAVPELDLSRAGTKR
jgi:putative nucleotidyltransferase with HDIG domain